MKKFFAILLALAMTFALSATALAEGETNPGSIKITNAIPGQKYSVYRLFDLTYNATNQAYSYTIATEWEGFFNDETNAGGKNLITVENGYVTGLNPNNSTTAATLAARAIAWAKDSTHSINPTAGPTAAPAAAEGQTTSTLEFTNLALGYYLIDSTLGALCGLTTTDPSAEVQEKNELPKLDKEVEEDDGEGAPTWGETNDGDIGQVVNFKATLSDLKGAEELIYHDKMSTGLTFDSTSVKVYKNSIANDNLVPDTIGEGDDAIVNWELVTQDLSDGCTFEVKIHKALLETLADNDKLIITYSATINENAVIGGDGNPNEGKLEYGDTGHTQTTPPDTTTTYTWPADIFKFYNTTDGETTTQNALAGAEFVLLNSDQSKVAKWTYVAAVEGDPGTPAYYKFAGWEDYTGNMDLTDNKLTSPEDGYIHLKGLDGGKYNLKEIKAPDGYNLITPNPTEFEITPTTSEDGETMTLTEVKVEVENKYGSDLPETGGIGTKIFYIVGAVLMIGAAVLLIVRKKMSVQD